MGLVRDFFVGIGAALGASAAGDSTPPPTPPAIVSEVAEVARTPPADAARDILPPLPIPRPDPVPAPISGNAGPMAVPPGPQPGVAQGVAAAAAAPGPVAPDAEALTTAMLAAPAAPPVPQPRPTRPEAEGLEVIDVRPSATPGTAATAPAERLGASLLWSGPAAGMTAFAEGALSLATDPVFAPGGPIDALFAGEGGFDRPGLAAPLPYANPLGDAVSYSRGLQLAALPPAEPLLPEAPIRSRDGACVARLAGLGFQAEVLPPVSEGACGMGTAIEIAGIGGEGGIAFTPAARVDCGITDPLSDWLLQDVQPAAVEHLGQRVTGIRVAASYACRGVNNVAGAELSEHAFGNAIDISAFRLADGSWLEIQPYADPDAPGARFQAAVREEACGDFTTVLGPGVALHSDHLHLDLARRGRNGNSLYCR